MKKSAILTFACMVFMLASCGAQYISADRLPQRATDFITKHYPGETIVSVESEGWLDGYDVILKNGTHIDFSRKGNLENIEAPRGKKLPAGISSILPAPLLAYLKANYPDRALTQVTNEDKRWEINVEGSGLELIFDARGNYLGADD